MNTKQVIVMRTDLNMRKGKMVAQGAHAAMAFITRNLHENGDGINMVTTLEEGHMPEIEHWLEHSFVKICVGVDSLDELMQIVAEARGLGLVVNVITDNGVTEFGGIPTVTCAAIGPHYSEQIDKVTKHLKLL